MNNIYYINSKEYNLIKRKNKGNMIVEIDGKVCKTLNDYFLIVYELLNFPSEKKYTYAGYIDWMCDSDYFSDNEILFCILNYNYFLKKDLEAKEKIINIFKNDILPWWDNDVKQCCIFGTTKKFNLYLID